MDEKTTNITGVIVDHSLSSRMLGRYIGNTTADWLERYGEITVVALIGEHRVSITFELQLEHIELVTDADVTRHDTFDYRASIRSDPGAKRLIGQRVEGRLVLKGSGLEELGTFRTV
jgi:hypothetical protein